MVKYTLKFTVLTIFKCIVSGIMYFYDVVQLSPPSISRTLSSQTETLYITESFVLMVSSYLLSICNKEISVITGERAGWQGSEGKSIRSGRVMHFFLPICKQTWKPVRSCRITHYFAPVCKHLIMYNSSVFLLLLIWWQNPKFVFITIDSLLCFSFSISLLFGHYTQVLWTLKKKNLFLCKHDF